MNCEWKPGSTDSKGWVCYQCQRCLKLSAFTPHEPAEWKGSQIKCKAWPLPHETDHWLAIFSAAVGITQAKAAFDSWLKGGAKVEELPAGVARPQNAPAEGPGTELAKLFKQLGIAPTANCGCGEFQSRMNAWGPECDAHREEILSFLKQHYDEASVLAKIKAGGLALAQGLPLSLEGLLDLAIENAKQTAIVAE